MMFVTRAVYSATTRIDCFMSRQLKRSARTETRVLSPAKKRCEDARALPKLSRNEMEAFGELRTKCFGVRCVVASLSWFAAKPVYETIRKWRAEPRATHNL